MRLSYRTAERNERTTALAEKIVALLIGAGVTYQEADDVLTIAQEMLMDTKPSNP